MQRWEYLKYFIQTVVFEGKEVVTSADSIVYGKKGKYLEPSPNCPKLIDYLNKLGEEGWELIQIESSAYFFKRPCN